MRLSILLLSTLAAATVCAQSISYSYDAAGRLSSVVYPNGKTLSYTYDAAGNVLRSLVGANVQGPAPAVTAAGVVNAASFLGGAVAPGELVTIFGTGIGPAVLADYKLLSFGFIDNYTGETSVLFDGIPAPLIYASAGQTTAIVPYSVAGKSSTQVTVVYQGRASAPVTLQVTPAAPALFSSDASGKGNGAILNQDNSVNTAANPAAKGSIVVLYGTGEGQTDPKGVDGRIATTVYPAPLLPVKVTIGGIAAEVKYAGESPFQVAGVFQVNVVVPAEVPSGAAAVVVTVGSASSQSGLTVSVR